MALPATLGRTQGFSPGRDGQDRAAWRHGGGGSHITKAGTRVAINTSPEPFTNWFASLAEDVFVIGLSLLTLKFPLLAWLVSAIILVMIVWLARRLLKWPRPFGTAQTRSR